METESFEDEEVAAILNKEYISIKVDREERPDVDAVYMSVCQSLTGSGGWPLTILMTPEQKPFYAGTYIPKTSGYGQNGLISILTIIADKWKTQRSQLEESGQKVHEHIKAIAEEFKQPDSPTKDLMKAAYVVYLNNFDPIYGGFGMPPKFPIPHNLLFLLRYSDVEQETKAQALSMVEKTLEQMYKGGIFDHIGGGFSRYSTDQKWLAPHFEKMLYDNAGLSYVYLEAYQKTKREQYRYVAEKTLSYVQKELTDPNGGFYCGQDADSEGVEGKYYVFTPKEIQDVLGEENANLFCQRYDITQNGNFEGKNIPNLIHQKNEDEKSFEEMKNKLYHYRKNRFVLHKDDKILTSWNGLMITAFCKAYRVLKNDSYLQTAKNAQEFIRDNLMDKKGELFVRWRDGQAAHAGQLDDYSFYVWALLELYESTLSIVYLKEAIQISELMLQKFFDTNNGGFYLYANDVKSLITRPKELYDGALPSGNSVAAYDLIKLFKLTGDIKWKETMEKQVNFMAGNVRGYLLGNSFALLAFLEIIYPTKELVYVSKKISNEMISDLVQNLEGYNIAIVAKTMENGKELQECAEFTKAYPFPEEGESYYLCENGACKNPVNQRRKLMNLI